MEKKYRFTAKSRAALLYFFRHRAKMIIVIIVLGILYAFAEIISIGMLLPLLSQIVSPAAAMGERGMVISFLFGAAQSISSVSPMISAILIFFTAILVKNIVGYCREISSVFLGLSVREHCQSTLFHRLLHADYSFFMRQRLGDLEYRVITAPNQMNNLVSIIPDLATEGFKSFLIISFLFIISPQVTLVIILAGVFFLWAIRQLSARVSYFTGKERVQASSDATVYCGQALQGIKLLRVFKAEGFWENLFGAALRRFYRFAKRDIIFAAMPSRLLETIAFGILCLAIGWVIMKHGNESMIQSIPVFGVFALALQRLLPSLNSIGRNSMLFMSTLPYGEATYDAMQESFGSVTSSGKMPAEFEQEILFRGVCLRYDGSEGKEALNNISFSIKKNRLTAIVGESGSGKTSILNLLLRVLEPTGGEILLDGIPLNDISTNEWYSRIGYVGQEVFMFNGSIRDNVLFGMKDKNDEEIYKALDMANAAEFVEKCSNGLDTLIGDNGIRLSGGQRQRLAIARALIRRPDMLILDEATSSVDNISEKLIKDTMKKLHKHITIINVAHRFSTIMDADEIVVLKSGMVVETGKFAELVQNGRYFRELYNVREDEYSILNVAEESGN